jgi:hypothetical protein
VYVRAFTRIAHWESHRMMQIVHEDKDKLYSCHLIPHWQYTP